VIVEWNCMKGENYVWTIWMDTNTRWHIYFDWYMDR
jgi:hypothetical protein